MYAATADTTCLAWTKRVHKKIWRSHKRALIISCDMQDILYAALILLNPTKAECGYALKALALLGASRLSEIVMTGSRIHACRSASPFMRTQL